MRWRAPSIGLVALGLVISARSFFVSPPGAELASTAKQCCVTPSLMTALPASESDAGPGAGVVENDPPREEPEGAAGSFEFLSHLGTEELPWEARISSVTGAAGLGEDAKAAQLMQMIAGLPEEALETATREALTRLTDRQYDIARARIINPQTHGMVLSVLFADLLERSDEIALPTLSTIARSSGHPFAAQARENLELLLGSSKQ